MSSIQSIKITKSFIKPRYKKVSNYFHLFDLPDDKIMIFYGSAGYYQGFLYDYRTEKIKRLASGFSQPLISGISNNLILESQNSHGEQIKKNVLENIKESSIEANRKPNILGFLISGGSGRYKIFRLFEKSKPLLARAGRARFVKSLTYITNRKAFLMIKENMLHYQGRKSNRYQALPLVALRFKLFTAGIIFEDLNGRLFFRRNPFFRDEQEMLELYDQAMRLKKH